MEINLLKPGYKKNPEFYRAFVGNQLSAESAFFSNETVYFPKTTSFPIYMGTKNTGDKKADFIAAIQVITSDYLQTSREVHFEELVWHSYFVTVQRDYILERYPTISENQADFENIVTKDFDWESYVYKCVLVAEYVADYTEDEFERLNLYNLVYDNLDLFNYLIKYPLFRTGEFVLKFLEVIDELEIAAIMKAKIKDRPDLGRDERYGRRVIFELNQSYPVVLVPMLEKDELKVMVEEKLKLYYTGEEILGDER